MQDRYAGDIGDYIKLALLRAVSPDRRLGVAWYLYPNEHHNDDGKHVAYLQDPERWRSLDPELFDALANMVQGERSVSRLEGSGVLAARYFDAPLRAGSYPPPLRCEARQTWFSDLLSSLSSCDLIFADPDNGLTDDEPVRRSTSNFGKRLPISEAKALAEGRSAIIYHHNTRFPGGHELEVDHWLVKLGNAVAIRANAFSCRTFFVLNPDRELTLRCEEFCTRWVDHRVWLQRARGSS
jgi:hypothetical protein